MKKPTERFTGRTDNYARYRPSYPVGVLDLLQREAGLSLGAAVADVGSGTGIFTKLLLEQGWRVHAVEPNDEMRGAAEATLADHTGFVSVPAPAEATGLPDGSVQMVTAAQAFHWFEPAAFRREAQRIGGDDCFVALIWNRRSPNVSAVQQQYEALLAELQEYQTANSHRDYDQAYISSWFGPAGCTESVFDNASEIDWETLRGGFLSASYAPLPGEAMYEPTLARLRALFDEHQRDGLVRRETCTYIYWGRLSG